VSNGNETNRNEVKTALRRRVRRGNVASKSSRCTRSGCFRDSVWWPFQRPQASAITHRLRPIAHLPRCASSTVEEATFRRAGRLDGTRHAVVLMA
jgi:hypothetical protein